MKALLDTLLYWSVMALMIPGLLAAGVALLAALRLHKPLQAVAATLSALTLVCIAFGVRSLHSDHRHERPASARSLAWGERTLAFGVPCALFFLAAQRRNPWGP